jgi:acetoin:2,6-dichlorophenolindophenol oxidoreductase subunit alpha
VIYLCENNLYNEYTHYSETTAGEITERAKAFGIPSEAIEGQDVESVHRTAKKLIERARKGEGPSFLLCNTYRFHGHHVGDIDRAYYRPKKEEEEWKERRDPVKLLADKLVRNEIVDRKFLAETENEIGDEIKAGAEFALNAPYPDPDEVDQDVYA